MLRLYITGGIELEHPGGHIGERSLPGRQGRRALAYLTVARGLPVARDALAEVVWGDGLPPAWEGALHALVSRLRGVLQQAGVSGEQGLIGEGGAYALRLPPETTARPRLRWRWPANQSNWSRFGNPVTAG